MWAHALASRAATPSTETRRRGRCASGCRAAGSYPRRSARRARSRPRAPSLRRAAASAPPTPPSS
eukprot:5863706-Prymnesium_polylepis.1